MEAPSEESIKNVEVAPQESSNVEEEFFEDGNIEFEGEFEEGSDFGFSPGFRYVPSYLLNLINRLVV